MAPTPVLLTAHNAAGSTATDGNYPSHHRKSFVGWFKNLVGSREASQDEPYELGELPGVTMVSRYSPRPDLGPTPNIGSVFEQSLPITPTSGTFYSSPHRIKGISDWFGGWTGSSRKHHQDQDGSYELETLIPWVPRVSRYPPQLPELDLGSAFHVGNIFRRDLKTDCKSIRPPLPCYKSFW